MSEVQRMITPAKPNHGIHLTEKSANRRNASINHLYRGVMKLASLTFGMAGSHRFQRPPCFDFRREPTDAMRIRTAKLPQD